MSVERVSARIKRLLSVEKSVPEDRSRCDLSDTLGSQPRCADDSRIRPEMPGNGSGEVLPLRARASLMAARENELVELLGCNSAEQIVHAVRNLQNNVVLLKALLAKNDAGSARDTAPRSSE